MFCNSCIVNPLIQCVSPTLDFHAGPVGKLPFAENAGAGAIDIIKSTVRLAAADWHAYERSWDFTSHPLLSDQWLVTSDQKKQLTTRHSSLATSYTAWTTRNRDIIAEMKRLEEENNRLFIDAYGLADELTPGVPIEQITLTVNPAYRYGKKVDSEKWIVDRGFGEELEARFRQDTMKELVSYAIGCMMGRYRLDRPGLIYAHSGNQDFEAIYNTREASTDNTDLHRSNNEKYLCSSVSSVDNLFKLDEDGIVPLTDTDWFDDDDVANRLIEFISVAWPRQEVMSDEWRVE